MMTRSPDTVTGSLRIRSRRSSSLSEGLLKTDQRNTAFELTLFTFWPPGPELRTKVNTNSESGIWGILAIEVSILNGSVRNSA
jgi:hypothetical protein